MSFFHLNIRKHIIDDDGNPDAVRVKLVHKLGEHPDAQSFSRTQHPSRGGSYFSGMRNGIQTHVFQRSLRKQHAVVDRRHIRLLGGELLSCGQNAASKPCPASPKVSCAHFSMHS